MNQLFGHRITQNKELLQTWVAVRQLYALVDPFFDLPNSQNRVKLDTRDTDPEFFDQIAWERVTYEPPYLVAVTLENLDWLLHTLSTERWGVFVLSRLPASELAAHLQKFVITKGPDGRPYFLRFHDASVLEVLLSTWNETEKRTFFGPIDAFCLPNLDTLDVQLWRNTLPQSDRLAPPPEDCLLSLKESQLTQCAEAIDRDLVKLIYWHLRNYHAKSVQHLAKSVLENRVQFAMQRARQYQLSSISDLAGFTALMFELAPNFDEHPSFRRVLADPALPPETKMKRLSQVITDREWDEALELYDRKFWQAAQKKNKAG